MPNASALIVDDEQDIRDLLSLALSRMGLAVETAETVTRAKEHLLARRFDLCLTDMRLPDGSGLDLIAHVAEHHRAMPIAMITAYGDVQSAVNALKAGAFDFVSKPVDLGTLRQLVQQALALRERQTDTGETLVGESAGLQSLREQIGRLARSQAPVLITGEAGVGKCLVAKQIHRQGPRAPAPFVEFECAAIAPEQQETALFGKAGAVLAAQGGSLLLHDVDLLAMPVQIKLHKAIQDKAIRAIGAFADTAIDLRILSTTRKDLVREAAAQRFRHDLLYRINVIELPVPPLRERPEDILPLAHAFLEEIGGDGHTLSLTPAAEQTLLAHPFPGNVPELENVLERAAALADGNLIDAGDLRFSRNEPAAAGPSMAKALPEAVEQLERVQIQAALEACRFNKTKAAAHLGITFRALRYKMDKLGME